MSVYVDPMRPSLPWGPKGRHTESCHLFADRLEELNRFAEGIGLQRSWFQARPGFPHYDLTKGMRIRAVKAGAKELTAAEGASRVTKIGGRA